MFTAATRSRWTGAVLLSLGVTGCYDGLANANADASSGAAQDEGADDPSAASSSDGGPHADPDGGVDACRQPSHAVYLGLARTCEGCHGEGTNFPAFANFDAFERLIVTDASLVARGNPEASDLLDLLAGTAAPPLRQMPPGASSFIDLEDAGLTDIGVDALRGWITELEPCDLPVSPGSPRFVRRVEAEHVQRMLYDQLDLTLGDVLDPSRFPVDDPSFGVLTPADNSEGVANARWTALGGADPLRGQQRQSGWSPLFFQTVGPMAQAWCRRAVDLDRDALFRHASRNSSSSTDVTAIRANLEYLYLRMLGVVATTADIDAIYQDVYLHYEATADAPTAWTAVCAALVRDPLWLTR